MYSISSRIQQTAQDQPSRIAIIDKDVEVSYAELSSSIDVVSRALLTLSTDDVCIVAVVADKRLHTVQLILAALHAGVVVVPISPLLKPTQIVHILKDSSASVLMCDTRTLTSIKNSNSWNIEIEHIIILDAPRETEKPSNTNEHSWDDFINTTHSASTQTKSNSNCGDHPAALLYTSGSTGHPKGVIFTHNNIYYGAASITEYLHNTNEDRILALMPFSFDYGLSQLTSAMFTGATLVLFEYFVPKGVIDAVVKYEITGLPAVPHVWNQLATLDWPKVEKLRYITSTGGRLSANTIRKLENALPTSTIYSMYGFTEAFRATYLPPEQLKHRVKSIGRAVPHAEVLIVDDDGNELDSGVIGELIQSGPLVSAGYWNDEVATKLKFRTRNKSVDPSQTLFAWSGDLAYRDKEGFLYYFSRLDDQFKINGYRITLSEIEIAISRFTHVQEVCVLCRQKTETAYTVLAFVTLSNKDEEDGLVEWCKKELPGYMLPNDYHFLDKMPVTPNNKIDKQALWGLYERRNEKSKPS